MSFLCVKNFFFFHMLFYNHIDCALTLWKTLRDAVYEFNGQVFFLLSFRKHSRKSDLEVFFEHNSEMMISGRRKKVYKPILLTQCLNWIYIEWDVTKLRNSNTTQYPINVIWYLSCQQNVNQMTRMNPNLFVLGLFCSVSLRAVDFMESKFNYERKKWNITKWWSYKCHEITLERKKNQFLSLIIHWTAKIKKIYSYCLGLVKKQRNQII